MDYVLQTRNDIYLSLLNTYREINNTEKKDKNKTATIAV